MPFGIRDIGDVTFPLAPVYARKGITFLNESAAQIDPLAHTVTTGSGQELSYDKLFLGTGPRLAFERIPGLGPEGGYTQSVCNLEHAVLAGKAWQRFLADPGPVVVGTAQGGSCFGASYEFLFNIHHQIKKAGIAAQAPLTFITAEPFVGHFGLGGVGESEKMVNRFMERLGIEAITNAVIEDVREDELLLGSGRTLPFRYSMIVPPFAGVDVVAGTAGLGNAAGFVPVDEQYRHLDFPDIFSAGVAIAIAPPAPTPVPAGVPKTGQMTEVMAKTAARNIAADLDGSSHGALPLAELSAMCILDAGNSGVIFKADRILAAGGDDNGGAPSTQLAPRARMSAGPQAHWAKLAFERVYLSSRKRGALVL